MENNTVAIKYTYRRWIGIGTVKELVYSIVRQIEMFSKANGIYGNSLADIRKILITISESSNL